MLARLISIIKSASTKETSTFQTRSKWSHGIIPLTEKHLKNSRVVSNRVELLKSLPKKGIVAEIGVEYGIFSKEILQITHPKKLILIDNNLTEKLKKNLRTKLFIPAQFILNDSVRALKALPNEYFDWVYIDTFHDYHQTKRELNASKYKVKKGGLICGHDYILYSYAEERRYGVIKAVNEFCTQYNWEIIYLTNEPHGYHSFVLRELI